MTMWLGYVYGGVCLDTFAPTSDENGEPVEQPNTPKQFWVQQELQAKGIICHCAKVIEVKRVGKRRRPDAIVRPLLPNYIFVECSDSQFLDVVSTKHVASTMAAIPKGAEPSVMAFLRSAQADFDRNMAKIAAGERIEQFRDGDLLKVLNGPLAGLTARFRGIIEHDLFPSVRAEVEFMGRTVKAELDVLDVGRGD